MTWKIVETEKNFISGEVVGVRKSEPFKTKKEARETLTKFKQERNEMSTSKSSKFEYSVEKVAEKTTGLEH